MSGHSADGDFVDIDAALMEGFHETGVEEVGSWEEATEQMEEDDDAAEDEVDQDETLGGRADSEYASGGLASSEDISMLTESELRERVRKSIEQLVPSDTAAVSSPHGDTSELTPAQIFYMENRDRLVSRAQEYYIEKQREQQLQAEAPDEVEDEWRFYHEPVMRPRKGHLWSTGVEGEGDHHWLEEAWKDSVANWPEGQLPSPEMLAGLLESEQARDVSIVDLYACGRHDVGTHGIVATGITSRHCRRLGDIVSRATQKCRPPHIEAFCMGTRNDEWVVAHCGPIKVHLFTRETRDEYKIELLWQQPNEFFQPGDFPHYLEVYTTATEAFPNDHVMHSTGMRTTEYTPVPFRDGAHHALMQPDYEAAEDIEFRAPLRVVGGSVATQTSAAEHAAGDAWAVPPRDDYEEDTGSDQDDHEFDDEEETDDEELESEPLARKPPNAER